MSRILSTSGRPKPIFTNLNAVAIIVGIVIGIGIFRLPPLVAANASSDLQFLGFWVAGGLISLTGALCYAELAAAHPDAGGEYYFLNRAYGPSLGFLFSWGRMTVIQTGSIALAGFILGDYASRIFNLGPYSSAIYAALTVLALTVLNIWGTQPAKKTQNLVTLVVVLMLLGAALFGIFKGIPLASASTSGNLESSGGAIGSAMIFVLLTYGGWNEASYLSAEIVNVKRNMARVLTGGIVLITIIYLLVNYAYLHILGLDGLRNSEAIGADLTEFVIGQKGAFLLSFIVIISAISTANATIITGARTNYAMGRDFPRLGFLGKWSEQRNAPVNALFIQGIISLLLVLLGALTKQSVTTMVEYTAPVFWFFLLLTGISLFIFRKRATGDLPFQVPLYPITPIIFVLTCVYMLYSSVVFTGIGAVFGMGILVVGIPVLLFARRRMVPTD